ncbi:MAG: glucose-6-phosphate dehydrogenase, partial [Verrucomicrobiota bacterium]|nr:glucose-6-phosphate dehydrogenase [Verrucomicrobiota bacterium]
MPESSVTSLRRGFKSRQIPEFCSIVIFGATGDLTHRKLVPALYNLFLNNELPKNLRVIGFARRDKTDQQWQEELENSNRENSRSGHDPEAWKKFVSSFTYHRGDLNDSNSYKTLSAHLDAIESENERNHNRLFYLSTAPEFFPVVLENLKSTGLNNANPNSWSRVIIEKPFGSDLKSAQDLNAVVNETFSEADTYRIDHYLGKETAQNIMVLRFANSIFEPLWRSRFIDHVQITCAEHLGMEGGRGGYYDKAGATRDMVQNHLLQLLSLVAMEPPTDLSADSVRDEKVKVLRTIRKMDPEQVAKNVIRAQYIDGNINGEPVKAYREEDRVDPKSMTESYVAMRLFIDNWRWEGTPFYIRMGKRLPKKTTEISLHLKSPPNVLFQKLPGAGESNILTIRIQPDEGMSVLMLSKKPGTSLKIEPVKMDFHYWSSFEKGSPEAYERLLIDAMIGDATLFARRDEVENAWVFIDSIE